MWLLAAGRAKVSAMVAREDPREVASGKPKDGGTPIAAWFTREDRIKNGGVLW